MGLVARIQNAGYLIWYQPAATIYHKESLTVGKEKSVKNLLPHQKPYTFYA